jgi:aspartyl-tRNA synthetase
VFIDLRDHYGITQLVFDLADTELTDIASRLRCESVITIDGIVSKRSEDSVNPKLPTGSIEVRINELHIESLAETLPLPVNSEQEVSEDLRLRYRFLDLRRSDLHRNIILRSQIISELRKLMTEAGFMEFQTPILTASSPEGARDFLVPSRLHPGKFYALPQAPQQFKQLLMIAGFDRYFQIAPCFRDEDARSDRSPGEFYQLDIEMSFVTQEDVFNTIEPVMYSIFRKFSDKKVTDSPFPRISYKDAMLKYGSDKPDLRNPLIITDVTEIFRNSSFALFVKSIQSGSVVRAVPAPKVAKMPRSFFDKMAEFAVSEGASGLGYVQLDDSGIAKGPIAKFLSDVQIASLKSKLGLCAGDAVFFSCASENAAAKIAGKVRMRIAEELLLIDRESFKFCWVTDFPLYELNEETQKIDFSHNPFSMPQGGIEILEKSQTIQELLDIKAYQYDIVCNGIELSSGAVRNHKPEIMYRLIFLYMN